MNIAHNQLHVLNKFEIFNTSTSYHSRSNVPVSEVRVDQPWVSGEADP